MGEGSSVKDWVMRREAWGAWVVSSCCRSEKGLAEAREPRMRPVAASATIHELESGWLSRSVDERGDFGGEALDAKAEGGVGW